MACIDVLGIDVHFDECNYHDFPQVCLTERIGHCSVGDNILKYRELYLRS